MKNKMAVVEKTKIQGQTGFYFEYILDTGHRYWVFDDGFTKAFTPTGKYPSFTTKRTMEITISKWESTQIQVPLN